MCHVAVTINRIYREAFEALTVSEKLPKLGMHYAHRFVAHVLNTIPSRIWNVKKAMQSI